MKTLLILVVSNSQKSGGFMKVAASYTVNQLVSQKELGKETAKKSALGVRKKSEILASKTILKKDLNLIGPE